MCNNKGNEGSNLQEEKEMKVKQVNVESRRSVKVGTEFITFTAGMVADLDKDEDEIEAIQAIFKKANDEVDNQIQQSVEDLT